MHFRPVDLMCASASVRYFHKVAKSCSAHCRCVIHLFVILACNLWDWNERIKCISLYFWHIYSHYDAHDCSEICALFLSLFFSLCLYLSLGANGDAINVSWCTAFQSSNNCFCWHCRWMCHSSTTAMHTTCKWTQFVDETHTQLYNTLICCDKWTNVLMLVTGFVAKATALFYRSKIDANAREHCSKKVRF